MNAEFISDIKFQELFEIEELEILEYNLNEIQFFHNNNTVYATRSSGDFDIRKNVAIFEIYLDNDPTEIFDIILQKFPNAKIINENTKEKYKGKI